MLDLLRLPEGIYVTRVYLHGAWREARSPDRSQVVERVHVLAALPDGSRVEAPCGTACRACVEGRGT